LMIGVKS